MSAVQDAIALIKAGDRKGGQRLLAGLLSEDPANEAAWLWMSSVVDEDEQRRYCLEQVLKYNPGHQAAQAGLARLQQSPAEEEVLPAESPELTSTAEQAEGEQQEEARDAMGDEAIRDQAPVAPATPPPAPDPAMMKDMADFVIARLGKHEGVDDIVPKLCAASGMSWSEATTFVQRVEEEHRLEIAGRQRPILLVVGVASLLIGAYLAYSSAPYLASFAAGTGGLSENPLSYLLSTPQGAARIITLALATAMLVAGLWGILRALLPLGKRSLPASGADKTRDEGRGSVEDFIGVHVSLGDEGIGPTQRRGRAP